MQQVMIIIHKKLVQPLQQLQVKEVLHKLLLTELLFL